VAQFLRVEPYSPTHLAISMDNTNDLFSTPPARRLSARFVPPGGVREHRGEHEGVPLAPPPRELSYWMLSAFVAGTVGAGAAFMFLLGAASWITLLPAAIVGAALGCALALAYHSYALGQAERAYLARISRMSNERLRYAHLYQPLDEYSSDLIWKVLSKRTAAPAATTDLELNGAA